MSPALVLGSYDRCWSCHQPCDADLPCPTCGAPPVDLAEALLVVAAEAEAPTRDALSLVETEEVNGHVFAPAESSCAYCGCSLERAPHRRCGG